MIVGGIILPLLVIVYVSSSFLGGAMFVMLLSLMLTFSSELSDRFLFYATVVPLGMAGGFFVGKQR